MQRGAETAEAVAADEHTAGAAEHNVVARPDVQKTQTPKPRRARLVNKRLSVEDAVLSQQAYREARFRSMISDVSTDLIGEFIHEELREIVRGIRTSRDRERLSFATRSRCTLRSAISGVERVVEFDRRITGRKLYTLARIALGLKSHADSTSILLTLGGSEVRPHDFACWQLFQDAHIEYVLHK